MVINGFVNAEMSELMLYFISRSLPDKKKKAQKIY